MNYWWVNHAQNVEEELKNDYIWSPKEKINGLRNQTYSNLSLVKLYDIIFSYAHGQIKSIGIIRTEAVSSPRPFGIEDGTKEGSIGWLVKVNWIPLEKPFRPKEYIEKIAPLLPQKYSPIQSNGNGNQFCYLAKISSSLGELLLNIAGMYDELKGLIDYTERNNAKTSSFDNGEKQVIDRVYAHASGSVDSDIPDVFDFYVSGPIMNAWVRQWERDHSNGLENLAPDTVAKAHKFETETQAELKVSDILEKSRIPQNSRITDEVAEILKSYVYIYTDPRDGKPFYIGRGKMNRIFDHLSDQSETEKVIRIKEIRSNGMEPQIDLLRYGLTDTEAALVEASAIDLIGKANLTNEIAGHHKSSFSRITSQDVIMMLTAKHVSVEHKALLITINKLYRSDMTPEELYEATRGTWKLGPRRYRAEYAMAVYQGIVREVYRIDQWYPAGTLEYKTRDSSDFKGSGRWEFSGDVAFDIRDEYVNFSVGKGGQNPIRYVNV